jgi:hypothetical protein
MEKIILKKPAQLVGVNPKVDRTLSLRFNTDEITPEHLGIWYSFLNTTGFVAFSPDNIQEIDMPKADTEFNTKTPSQRLYNVIFRYWEQTDQTDKHRDFYNTEMEKVINHYKNKLN